MFPSISKSQNIFHVLDNRELYHQTANLQDSLNNQIIENLKKENYTSWISQKDGFPNQYDRILHYDPKTNLLIVSNDSYPKVFTNYNITLKGWCVNPNSKKYDWTYEFDKSYFLTICKIAQKILIISNTIIGYGEESYSIIHLLNIQTGKKIAEINDDSKIINSCVNAKEKKIFTYSNDLVTKEWDFDGLLCRIIDTYQFPVQINSEYVNHSEKSPDYFLSRYQCLIRIYKVFVKTIHLQIVDTHYSAVITNLTNYQQKVIKISHTMRSVFLHKKYLLLGWHNSSKRNPSDFGILDISSRNFIFKLKAFKDHLSTKSTKPNAVEAIHCHKDLVFLAHTSGEIMIMNLANYILKKLGKQNGYVTHLCLKGKILISTDIYPVCPKLKFWDIESLKEITEIQIPNLKKFSLSNGKLHLIQNSSLIIRDYLISEIIP